MYLRLFLVTTFLVGIFGDFSYDDSSPNGPSNWGSISPNCNGKQQTPINLELKRAMFLAFPDLKIKDFNKIPESIKMVNTGYGINWTPKYGKTDRPTVSGGPLGDNIYVVDHFHVHWGDKNIVGSEHKINGQSFPMELHIVSQNMKYGSVAEALKYPDGLAVIGILYLIDSRTNDLNESPKLPGFFNFLNRSISSENKFLNYLSQVVNAGSEYIIKEPFNLNEVLKNLPLSYYTYKGSLTTPTCDEAVTWIVLREHLLIKKSDVEALRTMKNKKGDFIIKNYRPIQNLGHRFVLRTT